MPNCPFGAVGAIPSPTGFLTKGIFKHPFMNDGKYACLNVNEIKEQV